ncbi:MAG TPA: guanylate kinase [Thermoanaerobaculia bacterium]|nr:guanylate kinase [Thermoanaerobaculia bacterium]
MSELIQPGELFIVSAPSGTGKTTLIGHLLQEGLPRLTGLEFSVSYTTRKPRQGEIDGKDYHFVDHATFLAMISAHAFLEWAEVHGNYYGTAISEVDPRLERGIDVLLDIDVQGAERILSKRPEAHGIFIMPPSYDDLERRLHKRGLDDPHVIAGRLAVSQQEMARYDKYQYVIINDDARRASDVLASIILEKRHRRERMQARVQEILSDFEARSSAPSA